MEGKEIENEDIEEKVGIKGSEQKEEYLVQDNQVTKTSKPMQFKYKLIIIIAISFIIVGIITVTVLILLKKDNSNNNEQEDDEDEEEDPIEVLPPIIINPTEEYTHCIIWLHGLDNSPENFLNLFKEEVPFIRKNNTKIILMRAPYQIISINNFNITSWFDLLSFPINNSESYNFTDANKSKRVLEKVINQEAELLNGKYQNIFVGGHSQGACISLYTAYNFKELLGGVLACSGILFPQGKIVGDKNKLKVFLAHGDKDESIPFSFHKETVKRIENFEGVRKYYYRNHRHDITDYEKVDMSGFLNDSMV
jgi:predicted esterase